MNWIKYNLQKDGTPVWDGVVPEETEARIQKLQSQGYNPRIDHKLTK